MKNDAPAFWDELKCRTAGTEDDNRGYLLGGTEVSLISRGAI